MDMEHTHPLERIETEGRAFDLYYLEKHQAPITMRECAEHERRVVVHVTPQQYGKTEHEYGDYVLFPEGKTVDDVAGDLHIFVEGDASLEWACDYLPEASMKRLLEANEGRDQLGRFTELDLRDHTLQTWPVIFRRIRRGYANSLERHTFDAIVELLNISGSKDSHAAWVSNEEGDAVQHVGKLIAVEPHSPSWEIIKPFVDHDDLAERYAAMGGKLANIFELYLHACLCAADWFTEDKITEENVDYAISLLVKDEDLSVEKYVEYAEIFKDLCRDEGLEVYDDTAA